MRIISWNVNGIRAVTKKGFFDWMHRENPDILCLQETKAHPDQLDFDVLHPNGYFSYWAAAERKGYSGVALYTKTKPLTVVTGLGTGQFDTEGRTLIAEYPSFVLFNVYFPNGGAGNKRVRFKMDFYEAFQQQAVAWHRKGKPIIIGGDVNTAHTEIDLARPKENEKNTGFLPEERAWIDRFIAAGYVDTFRYFCSEPGHYTWWDYKTRARQRDVGWRLDYFFVAQELLPKLKTAFILKEIQGSDHCPVGIELF